MCHRDLDRVGPAWTCEGGHSFDVARQGYVNLLRNGRRRAAGDSAEMVAARGAFLASGAYQPISDEINDLCSSLVAEGTDARALDVGCGEGYYTRRLGDGLGSGVLVAGIDVAKPAVAAAASAHPLGYYAVGSAFDLPVPTGAFDLVLSVFGPIAAAELARVLKPGGAILAVHPGPRHLFSLRSLVYEDPRPHQVKDPLRALEAVELSHRRLLSYPLAVSGAGQATQLLTMTPYRWHAPRDIAARLESAGGFDTEVDVVLSTYRPVG